ncbi:hypothetical protein ACTWQB_16930 [Piscibacillus sp. B03]|uniref:hypothetical protein n=1 Tax=Piscibacillus sp. B03 TaxID=3457430 RepID=UPI003FCD2268
MKYYKTRIFFLNTYLVISVFSTVFLVFYVFIENGDVWQIITTFIALASVITTVAISAITELQSKKKDLKLEKSYNTLVSNQKQILRTLEELKLDNKRATDEAGENLQVLSEKIDELHNKVNPGNEQIITNIFTKFVGLLKRKK